MKNILGLDIGTNSIGWAVVKKDDDGKYLPDIQVGSRIIPMTQDALSNFEGGSPIETPTSARTQKRGVRKLYQRRSLRRERLLKILHLMDYLPYHYDTSFGWDKRNTKTFAKPLDHSKEVKIAWDKDENGKPKFIFPSSFEEMLSDFLTSSPKTITDGKRVPYDWTIYYLRNKALSQEITKEELSWILLNFNQKRGYYQLRGKDELSNQEDDKSKSIEYIEAVVTQVEMTPDEKSSGNGVWYNIHLDNGMIYRRQSKISLDNWVGKKKKFIVTTELNPDGSAKTDKEGNIKRSFRAPKENDWTLRKVCSENSLEQSGLYVGAYIYQHLLEDPSGKIIGDFVQTIDRHYYKEELYAILNTQARFHPELKDVGILCAATQELYPNNEAHRIGIQRKDMINLIIEDILFYQRPLKSKKTLISNCPYETHSFIDKQTGEIKSSPVKCVAKSNPYFQEFRIRQFIQNLKVYDTSGRKDEDVTSKFFADIDSIHRLYNWLSSRSSITQESFLKDYLKIKKPNGRSSEYNLRWNYVQDKSYPVGETKSELLKGLDKAGVDASIIDDFNTEYRLWHLLYSIDDSKELECALRKFAKAYKISNVESFVGAFLKIKPFSKEYGSYSEKAIKKLLPLMRSGTPLHEACMEIYSRFSEGVDTHKWNTPNELRSYIMQFQQHSLRNPIVEQCVLETLRTVSDIWEQIGQIDEIHLELGKEMKNPADKRKRISEQNQRNENTNLRIKAILQELMNDPCIVNVRPNSPMQQDILRIYEEGALLELNSSDPNFKEILSISQMAQPSASQIARYKLWLEQRYRSPYTGKVIPLSRLFTTSYQIEHIIPRSRYYDNSMNNKVICEAEVNLDKANLLAYEYIATKGGSIINTASGSVKVFTLPEYEAFIKEHYIRQKPKLSRLMMDDIPEEFIQRQMNDSRYISKLVKSILSNIVREEDEEQDSSRNLIVCTGGVTDRLKKDWGMNDVWNQLVYPRYERLNHLTGTSLFGHWEYKEGHLVFQTSMPLLLQKGYNKKRIDHRHHAMDALVIACANRNIVNLLSNLNAHETNIREDLRHQLSGKRGIIYKPWENFTLDAFKALDGVVVSFKNRTRVLTKATNKYDCYQDGKKVKTVQSGGRQYAVRKPLHKDSVFGHVNLSRTQFVSLDTALSDIRNICDKDLRSKIIDGFNRGLDKKVIKKELIENGIGKQIEVRYMTDSKEPLCAIRKPLDSSFDEKKIASITDTGIQKILLSYLRSKNNNPVVAFSPEGILELNEHITEFNGGKQHQPIRNVRVSEPMGEKYPIGNKGSKSKKFVEAQSGTNLFFGIYADSGGKRTYSTIPLYEAVESMKQGIGPVPPMDNHGNRLVFSLSPTDLVYVPTEDENQAPDVEICKLDGNRIYKFVDSSGTTANFIPHRTASLLYSVKKEIGEQLCTGNIVVQNEYGVGSPQSKNQKSIDGIIIKAVCWKLKINRLGRITKIIR